jgi:hypothetical protein
MGNPTCVKCGEPTPARIRGFTGWEKEDGELFGITYTGDFICARCYLELTPEEALSFLPAADDLGQ